MKLVIEQGTYAVRRAEVEHLHQLPGVTNNGQHVQLAGHVLFEVRFSGGNEFLLFHSDTPASNGHVDIFYYPSRRDGEYGVTISQYCQHAEVSLHDRELQHIWPTGGFDLLMTIIAIEKFLEAEIGYTPRLADWIAYSFRQVDAPANVAQPAA